MGDPVASVDDYSCLVAQCLIIRIKASTRRVPIKAQFFAAHINLSPRGPAFREVVG